MEQTLRLTPKFEMISSSFQKGYRFHEFRCPQVSPDWRNFLLERELVHPKSVSNVSFVLSWFCSPPFSSRVLWSMFVTIACLSFVLSRFCLPLFSSELLHWLPTIRRSSHEDPSGFFNQFRCGRSMFITVASLSFVLSRFCLPLFSFCVQYLTVTGTS